MQSALIFSLEPDAVTAFLCDSVEGRYRLLASAEVAGWDQHGGLDLPAVASAAVAELEQASGRSLLARGRPAVPEAGDGNGVDMVLAVGAPRGSLRVAVVGADSDLAFDSGPRLVEGAGHVGCHELCLDQHVLRARDVLFDAVRSLWESQPDVVLVAASASDRAAEELAHFGAALGAVASAPGPALPAVIFAGSESQEIAFRHALGVGLNVERIEPLRPSPEEERLEEGRASLAQLLAARWMAALPGYKRFSAWLASPIVSRDMALGRVMRYLANAHGGQVLGIDFDRRGVAFFLAAPGLYASYRGRPKQPWERLRQWLEKKDDDEALGNLLLRPWVPPQSAAEAQAEGAWLRGLCREALEDTRVVLPEVAALSVPVHVVATGRGCGCAFSKADAALLVMDSLQPAGIGYLRWDAENALAAAGVLASIQPRLAADLVEDVTLRLAAFVAPSGAQRPGAPSLELDVTYPDKSGFRVEVAGGNVEAVPVGRGERVVVEVHSRTALDANGAWGRRAKVEFDDTPLGVIVDARGRPLPAASAGERRQGLERALVGLGAAVTLGVVS